MTRRHWICSRIRALPSGTGFTWELLARLVSGVLPEPPDTRDLADIIDRLFPRHSVGDWLDGLDAELGNQIVSLFHYEEIPDESRWNSLRIDLEDAMVQLADRICVVGSSRGVRARLSRVAFRDLPFQKLAPAVEALLARRQAGVPLSELAAELNVVRGAADACDRAVEEVIGRLEKTGVSTALVYDIERLRAQVRRLELLLEAWVVTHVGAGTNVGDRCGSGAGKSCAPERAGILPAEFTSAHAPDRRAQC